MAIHVLFSLHGNPRHRSSLDAFHALYCMLDCDYFDLRIFPKRPWFATRWIERAAGGRMCHTPADNAKVRYAANLADRTRLDRRRRI